VHIDESGHDSEMATPDCIEMICKEELLRAEAKVR